MHRISFFRKLLLAAAVGTVFVLSACNPTRNLKEGQYFFKGYKIKQDNQAIDKEALHPYVWQKPNRKFFLLFRLQMGFYNFGNLGDTTVEGTKFLNHLWKITKRGMRIIGEEPVVLDTALVSRSTHQLKFFMDRKGYFDAVVTDTIIYKKKKANVIYSIQFGAPYKIKSIEYASRDTAAYSLLLTEQKNSFIHPGMTYDEDILDAERERFTDAMKSHGIYFFTRQFITYSADSALQSHEINLKMNVSRLKEDTAKGADETAENHHQYYLNRIFIRTDYDPKSIAVPEYDTVLYKNYFFLVNKKHPDLRYRRDVLLRAIFISQGDIFNLTDVKYSYSRLTDLNVFRFVNIRFNEVPRDDAQKQYLLDVEVLLTPLNNQDFTIETEGTHNAGDFGIAGNVGYRHKNRFKGAEQLEVKFKAAWEFQKGVSEGENRAGIFNTYEIGPEVSLNLKKLLLIDPWLRNYSQKWNPRTRVSVALNYQQQPDYSRAIGNMNFSWKFKTTPPRQWYFDLFDINYVNVELTPSFVDKLIQINDKGLFYSYSDHLITSGRINYVFNNQGRSASKNSDFYQAYFEFSGLVLSLLGNAPFIKKDSLGFEKAFGLTYSQYVKIELDIRHYQNFAANNILVIRGDVGVGVPYTNSIALPFEKSFFGGGSNSLRAWRYRSLGPGSYINTYSIEQTGDMKVEANVELRSPLFKRFEGAAFFDAGNIWLFNQDSEREGAQFNWGDVASEIAIGGGLGIRFNFTYFIFRLDAAVKLRDPSLPDTQRWVYGTRKFAARDINYNFGIGYPF